MAELVEVSELFRNCVRRRKAMGLSGVEAERLCHDTETSEPSDPVMYRPPFVTPATAEGQEGPQEPPGRPEGDEGDPDPTDEALTFWAPSARTARSRWRGHDLTPGTVPAWRDPRTEAHIWAKEMVRVGQRPPFNRVGWEEHATRMGLSPQGVQQGWDYIHSVFSQTYEKRRAEAVEAAGRALGEGDPWSGGPPPYGGYYATFPHELKVNMPQGSKRSFPFHTKAAQEVYAAASKIIEKNPNIDAEGAYRQAMGEVGVNVFEMTPEDDAIMGIALNWEITGKHADPEPPRVSTQGRPTSGMKGTQIGYGREISPRGAP